MELTIQNEQVDVSSLLPKQLVEALNDSLDYIHKYSTEEEWKREGITKKDKYLRAVFWSTIDDCVRRGVKLRSAAPLYEGIMTRQTFYRLMRNPARAGYVFSKPLNHDLESRVMLDRSHEQVIKILTLPLINDKGNVNTSVMNAQIKIWKALTDRVHGQTVQRIQQHNVNENKKVEGSKTMEDYRKELAELEGMAMKTLNPSE